MEAGPHAFPRPSAALIVALTALVVAMSGAALALPGKDSVGPGDIRKNAVRSQEVEGKSLKGNDLKDDAIASKQVKPESLHPSDLTGFEIADDSLTRIVATEGADVAAARAAAPETKLYQEGQLTIYAKCFRGLAGTTIRGEIYARTSVDGALLDGADQLPPTAGSELLNTGTPEEQRRVSSVGFTAVDAAAFDTGAGAVASPDGTSARLLTTIGAKQGNLATGNGAFGDGNVCLFGLDVIG